MIKSKLHAQIFNHVLLLFSKCLFLFLLLFDWFCIDPCHIWFSNFLEVFHFLLSLSLQLNFSKLLLLHLLVGVSVDAYLCLFEVFCGLVELGFENLSAIFSVILDELEFFVVAVKSKLCLLNELKE